MLYLMQLISDSKNMEFALRLVCIINKQVNWFSQCWFVWENNNVLSSVQLLLTHFNAGYYTSANFVTLVQMLHLSILMIYFKCVYCFFFLYFSFFFSKKIKKTCPTTLGLSFFLKVVFFLQNILCSLESFILVFYRHFNGNLMVCLQYFHKKVFWILLTSNFF